MIRLVGVDGRRVGSGRVFTLLQNVIYALAFAERLPAKPRGREQHDEHNQHRGEGGGDARSVGESSQQPAMERLKHDEQNAGQKKRDQELGHHLKEHGSHEERDGQQ